MLVLLALSAPAWAISEAGVQVLTDGELVLPVKFDDYFDNATSSEDEREPDCMKPASLTLNHAMKRLELLIHISGISGAKDMLGRDPVRSEYMLGFVPQLSSPVLFDALEKNAKDLKGKKEKYGLSDFTVPKPEKEALYDFAEGWGQDCIWSNIEGKVYLADVVLAKIFSKISYEPTEEVNAIWQLSINNKKGKFDKEATKSERSKLMGNLKKKQDAAKQLTKFLEDADASLMKLFSEARSDMGGCQSTDAESLSMEKQSHRYNPCLSTEGYGLLAAARKRIVGSESVEAIVGSDDPTYPLNDLLNGRPETWAAVLEIKI